MEQIIQELRQDFINDLPNALDSIISSHMAGDMEALFQAVHKLKGAAGVCQHDKVVMLCDNYCEALREKRYNDIDLYHGELILALGEIDN